MDEKLYVIGGSGSNSSDHSWETFDPLTNCWTSQTDPKIVSEIKHSVVLDGNIYVRCARFCANPRVFSVVYKPSSGTWQYADDDMVSGWRGPVVVVDGTLYVLDQSLGRTRLMMSLKERREWIPVGRLLPLNARPPFQLAEVGLWAFIVALSATPRT